VVEEVIDPHEQKAISRDDKTEIVLHDLIDLAPTVLLAKKEKEVNVLLVEKEPLAKKEKEVNAPLVKKETDPVVLINLVKMVINLVLPVLLVITTVMKIPDLIANEETSTRTVTPTTNPVKDATNALVDAVEEAVVAVTMETVPAKVLPIMTSLKALPLKLRNPNDITLTQDVMKTNLLTKRALSKPNIVPLIVDLLLVALVMM
jgi:hypothetical protein